MKRTTHLITASAVLSACLLPISIYASADTKTNQEIRLLKKEIAILNKKVDVLGRKQQHSSKHVVLAEAQPTQSYDMKAANYNAVALPPPINHALYIKHNYPNFYEIVTANSPQSYANNDLCIKGMICFSALANFDLLYTDRRGFGFQPGSAQGVGVRPLFGPLDDLFLGSINNVDLFVDAAVNNWVSAHIDLAYVNGSRKTAAFPAPRDIASVYDAGAALKVNEAYLLFADPSKMPFFVQLGRIYAPFGDYDPYPMIPSLTELVEQTRTGGINFGAIFQNGLYGEAYWGISQQTLGSVDSIQFALSLVGAPVNLRNNDRNYGGKIGFRRDFMQDQLHVNVNASWIADIRDSDYFTGGANVYNIAFKSEPIFDFFWADTFVVMQRAPATALHADIRYKWLGVSGDYVTALSPLNPLVNNSEIWAYDFNINLFFPIFNMPSTFSAGFQKAGNASIYRRVDGLFVALFPIEIGNVLPDYRYTVSYEVNVMPWVTVAAQWVRDYDWAPAQGGTNRTSNLVIARVSAQI